jgi:hypothetical protein
MVEADNASEADATAAAAASFGFDPAEAVAGAVEPIAQGSPKIQWFGFGRFLLKLQMVLHLLMMLLHLLLHVALTSIGLQCSLQILIFNC